MKKICFILPYFGNFPTYIDAFFESCKDNSDYDFIIITDNSQQKTHRNIKYIIMTFSECQELIRNKLKSVGINKCCIHKPYKLCDYKPCYGYIFSDYIADYKYWGHIDCDLIFGKLSNFLNKIEIEKYDRIFRYGHLSLYKNNNIVNLRFLDKVDEWCDFRQCVQTTLATHYDELRINYLYKKRGYPFYEENFSVTFALNEFSYKSGESKLIKYPQLFVKMPHGEVRFYWLDENNILNKRELLYVHFMSRADVSIETDFDKPYLLTPFGAVEFNELNIHQYFKDYGNLDNILYLKRLKKNQLKKRFKTLLNELKYNKLNAIKYYYKHIKPSPFKNWD